MFREESGRYHTMLDKLRQDGHVILFMRSERDDKLNVWQSFKHLIKIFSGGASNFVCRYCNTDIPHEPGYKS